MGGDGPASDLTAVSCPSDTIAVGGTLSCTATLTVDQAMIDLGDSIVNTATASSADRRGATMRR
ncbi:MAG: hypothetical protein R3D57_06845 [Hyphomicrobiaceae bacterium]